MQDEGEDRSMMGRAQAVARAVQEASDVVGTAKTGLETAMAKLELSVRCSEELVQEVGSDKVTELDAFQAWIEASRSQKGVIAKVVLDELAAYRKWCENDRLIATSLHAATLAGKRVTDSLESHETKRFRGNEDLHITATNENATDFFLGGSSDQSPEVIIVSSSEGASGSSGPSENGSDVEDNEPTSTELTARGHIDEEGVQRLDHIGLPLSVKKAFILLEREEPWVQWLNHFRSFLPGLTKGQRQWNSQWYHFWKQFGEVVWQRYFYVGVGQYRENPQTVHPTAQASRKMLERAKSKLVQLIVALKRLEGLEVFEFLFFNVHPFWPELAQDPCSLRGLSEVVPDGSKRAVEYMRQYGRSRFPDFSSFPGLMGPRVMAKYTFEKAAAPARHVSWSWKILLWCARHAGDTVDFVPALAQRLNSGLAAQRTEPFPYVQYADETWCHKPEWLARQDEMAPNLQGLYVAGSGSVRAISRATGQEVEGSDVSGDHSGTITL